MKDYWKKYLCLCMVLSMGLCTLAGCGKGNPSEDTAGNGTVATSVTDTVTETETSDPVQDKLDAIGQVDYGGGDLTVAFSKMGGYDEEVIGYADSKKAVGSAVINDAVYERNSVLESTCHLHFKWIEKDPFALNALLVAEAGAPTGDFQFVNQTADLTGAIAPQGVLYDFLKFENIDYTDPWWDQGTASFKLGNRLFFMSGAHNIVDDSLTYMMAFNKKLAGEYQLENPYIAVKNGTWTLPHFYEVTAGISAENGDGQWDENDLYAFTASHVIGNSFMYGTNQQLVKFDSETGVPILALDKMGQEKLNSMLGDIQTLLHQNNTTFLVIQPDQFFKAGEQFTAGRAVFFSETVAHLRGMNETMEEDYGVLPMPKYDESQDQYYSWTCGAGSTLSLPSSLENPETIGKVLEIYSALSYRYVMPEFTDTLINSRVVRDVESAQVLEILFHNRIFDMAQYFDLGLRTIFSDAVNSPNGQFASRYTAAAKHFDRTIRTIMKQLEQAS